MEEFIVASGIMDSNMRPGNELPACFERAGQIGGKPAH
jgi:hypothetical protein